MRPIDADALRRDIDLAPDEWAKGRTINGIIDEQPTIDAEPVRHGRWIDLRESYNDVPHARCSVCGNVIYGIEYAHKYCFRCGAKMDLEVRDV